MTHEAMTDEDEALVLRPLTARSVLLSALLGTHPPRLPVRSLVRVGELFEIAEGTVRVALSRLVAAGDVVSDNGGYRLTERLLSRQARQDESRSPHPRDWDGGWEIAVVTAERRSAAERSALRQAMTDLRLAELREGTWLRPANLVRARPAIVRGHCAFFTATPEGDAALLAASLWDLGGWARRARALQSALRDADGLAAGFVVSAGVLRHFLSDPLLPAALVPADWPGQQLRTQYEEFDARFREQLQGHLVG